MTIYFYPTHGVVTLREGETSPRQAKEGAQTVRKFASVHHVFNFDLRHFAQSPEQWWDVNSSNWPIGAALRSRYADVTMFHVIGQRDESIDHLRVHGGTYSGPGVGRYGSDLSWSLLQTLRKLGPKDVIYLHEAGWPASQLLVEMCPNAYLVGVYHGNGSGGNVARVRRLDAHIVLRHEVGTELRELGVSANRIFELTPTVGDGFLLTQSGREPVGDVTIGFIGRPYSPKGIDDVVGAVNGLAATENPTRLELVGAALPEDAEAVSSIHKRLERRNTEVRLVGRVSNRDLPRIMAKWTLLAFPSHAEGCPRSVLEAAAMGIPTVGIEGVIPDKIVDGKTVITVQRQQFTNTVLKTVGASRTPTRPPFVKGHDWGGHEFDRVLESLPSTRRARRRNVAAVAGALRDSVTESQLASRVAYQVARARSALSTNRSGQR